MATNQKLLPEHIVTIRKQLFRQRLGLVALLTFLLVPMLFGLNDGTVDNMSDFFNGHKYEISGVVTEVKTIEKWRENGYMVTIAGRPIEMEYSYYLGDSVYLEYYPGSKTSSFISTDSFQGVFFREVPIDEEKLRDIKIGIGTSLTLSAILLIVFSAFVFHVYRRDTRLIKNLPTETYSTVEGVLEEAISSKYSIMFQINGIKFRPPLRFGKYGIKGESVRLFMTDNSKIIFHVEWM